MDHPHFQSLSMTWHFLKMGNVAHNFLHLLEYPLDNKK